MQLIVALLVLIGLSTAAEAAGQRPLGRGSRGSPDCPVQGAICTVSAPVFSFGRHPITGSTNPSLAQGSVTVNCDKNIREGFLVTISLDLSGLPPADPRQLTSGQGSLLEYGMYLDPMRTRVWGDGSRGTDVITDTLEMRGGVQNVSRTYLLYGTVTGGQPATTGNYLGAINAELRYGAICGVGPLR